MTKTIAITTLGCKINQFESAAMSEALEQDGFSIVPFTEPADFYVINSCTVTAKTDAESRRLIRRAARLNPRARVVVTGCYAQMSAEELLKIPEVSLVLGNSEKRRIAELIRGMNDQPAAIVADVSQMVCPHLHLPLQSGSDGVLARMNRGYDSALYRRVVESLQHAIPDICLGTDVIVGFPGESDQEFSETYRFIESLPLAYLHVFPFSPRPGTPAAAMTPQLHSRVIKERAEALRQLSESKKQAYAEGFIGRELQVLVQKDAGERKGLSRNYLPVLVEGSEGLFNREVTVQITAAKGGELVGNHKKT